MLSTLVYTSLLVLAPALKVVAFEVSTPEITECGDIQFEWNDVDTETTPPYSVWIINPEDPCEDPYVDLGADHMHNSMTWRNAGVPEGLEVQISMQDRNGLEAWSGIITVKAPEEGVSCTIPEVLQALAPTSTSTTASSTSTTSSSADSGSTLVVTPTTTSSPDTTVAPVAAGAAKDQGLGNAASSVKSSTPLVLAGALVGALFVAL